MLSFIFSTDLVLSNQRPEAKHHYSETKYSGSATVFDLFTEEFIDSFRDLLIKVNSTGVGARIHMHHTTEEPTWGLTENYQVSYLDRDHKMVTKDGDQIDYDWLLDQAHFRYVEVGGTVVGIHPYVIHARPGTRPTLGLVVYSGIVPEDAKVARRLLKKVAKALMPKFRIKVPKFK